MVYLEGKICKSINIIRLCNHRRRISFSPKFFQKGSISLENQQKQRIRNIGIIAHIDAGKTTVTEQLLFLTGTTSTIGTVDDGNTITDFMDIERERGITIQSAAVSSYWRDHRINLIDTPGHVDFTVEVERCLRVLDGVITILDGSAGVQAQTLTVWKQADKFRIPAVFFVNKMDKSAADFAFSLASIEERLNAKVIPLVVPVFNGQGGHKLDGFIDVLNRKFLQFDQTETKGPVRDEHWREIPTNTKWEQRYLEAKENLILGLADVDKLFEQTLNSVSNSLEIPPQQLVEALRRNTLTKALFPLAFGSALHCTQSIRPLLDMVVDYLPSPQQREYRIAEEADLCAFVFKVRHEKMRGQLNYIRLFKGKLLQASSLINANTGEHHTNYRLFSPFSDVLNPSSEVKEGNIAVITGLANTRTGDTLVNCTHINQEPWQDKHIDFEQLAPPSNHRFNKKLAHLVLEGIEMPEPVFSCTLEPPSTSLEQSFRKALSELLVEDPSLRVHEDLETGQTILEGMGELHMEIVKERFHRDYKMKVFMGPLQVAYKVIPSLPVEHSNTMEDVLAKNQNQHVECSLRFELIPLDMEGKMAEWRFKGIELDLEPWSIHGNDTEKSRKLLSSRPDWIHAINDGASVALHNGPLMGLPVANVRVRLSGFAHNGRIQSSLLSACASQCITQALSKSSLSIFEPLMAIEIVVVAGRSGFANTGILLSELNKRRAMILDIRDQEAAGKTSTIHAMIPLAETRGISNTIRSICSGLASFHMNLTGYQQVRREDVQVAA